MKKVVVFLLAFLIFTFPVTTLVKADVVIGNNDEYINNINTHDVAIKYALLESLAGLLNDGVTEISFDNVTDIDSYLDGLWNDIENSINDYNPSIEDYVNVNTWQELKNLHDWVENRANDLGLYIPNGDSLTTSLLSDLYNNAFNMGKQKVSLRPNSLHGYSALQRFTSSGDLDPTLSFITNINFLYFGDIEFHNITKYSDSYYLSQVNPAYDLNTFTYYIVDGVRHYPTADTVCSSRLIGFTPVITVDITSTSLTTTCTYSYNYQLYPWGYYYATDTLLQYNQASYEQYGILLSGASWNVPTFETEFAGLSTCLNYLFNHFYNININLNNEPLVLIGQPANNNQILNIDGLKFLFNNDKPIQYDIPNDTKIDYDKLYQVIKNAIDNGTSVNQQTINNNQVYYDSHDNYFMPTIINNYGSPDSEGESDLIDTILNYAIIPKFDTALGQPIETPLTNGVLIMLTGVSNIIPHDILLVLGAAFFLLLFAVIINRLIE